MMTDEIVNMGILSTLVRRAIEPYAKDTETSLHIDDLAALRRKVDGIVNGSPFAGQVVVLIGWDMLAGNRLSLTVVRKSQYAEA
jgi:hypothetical protein